MKRETFAGTFSLLSCLNHSSSPSSTSLRSGFPNCIILDPLCSNAFFPNRLNRRIYETKFPTHVGLFFIFYFSYHFIFPFDAPYFSPREQGDCWIPRLVYFLENYTGTDDWDCRYIRGRCSLCSIQQGRQTHALWGISCHYWMCDDIVEVSR